ncbi:MAG TPA: hypothetical protein VKY19_11185 [Ktedonosporobacter sp.]|jgi:hypothetical protein|nr:hypothetical protein [Ktedonosporobacter sp.]
MEQVFGQAPPLQQWISYWKNQKVSGYINFYAAKTAGIVSTPWLICYINQHGISIFIHKRQGYHSLGYFWGVN